VKNNNYNLDKDILTIKTECGDYSFKIDDDTGLGNAQRIAEVMTREMEKVEKKFGNVKEGSNPYAKMLMANLNISDKYIQLHHKYSCLIKKYDEMKTFYQQKIRSDDTQQDSLKKDQIVLKSKTSDNKKNVGAFLPGKKTIQKPAQRLFLKTNSGGDETPRTVLNDKKFNPENSGIVSSSERPAELTAQKPAQMQREQIKTEKSKPEGNIIDSPVQNPAKSSITSMAESRGTSGQESAKTPQTASQNIAKTETFEIILTEASMPVSAPVPAETSAPPVPSEFLSSSSQLTIKQPDKRVIPFERIENFSDEFQLPSTDFLKISDVEMDVDHEAIRIAAELLEQKLGYFGITGEVMEVAPGPVITTFEYKPAPGIKISKIVNLADDLALALSALSIRIVAPIPGKDVIGIEIPNAKKNLVPFIDIVSSDDFINIRSRLPICLGKDIIGNPVVVGLEKMPHLLIAGATGTGKSVGLNAMIASILYKSSPDVVKFIMIDPKRIELSLFNDIPHLITPVITDMKKANLALQWVVKEMERRYEILAKLQVRNIEQYNQKIITADLSKYDDMESFEKFSYIVVIIDELADLMMTAAKDIELSLTRIAQMARAAGIHLILATQRPSVDVLTGIIKANFPTRISFQVSSKTDSRTIIDSNGAETLLGRGDMLFVPPGTARLSRVHGTYLSEEELLTITNFLKKQRKPEYVFDVFTENNDEPAFDANDDDYDEKYQAALEFVLASRQASISGVQRALRVGYNRAARIIDLMEKKGIVGPSDGAKPREVLIDRMF
jgi:S-DNA-T family DNA segregation ATPase FtsK/SpoIIIE